MRCSRVSVEPDTSRGDRAAVVLDWTWKPPGEPYPEPDAQLRLFPPSAFAPLPLGVGRDGQPVGVQLFDRSAGAARLLIGGVPGSGKSNALRAVLAGLAPTTAQLVVIDPAGGAEARSWEGRASLIVATSEPRETMAALHDVLALVESRSAAVGRGVPTSSFLPLLLVIDELAELASAGTPKEQEEARRLVRRVAALGRKAQVGALLATQRTTSVTIDTTTRAFATWRLALAHPSDRHGSEALLGPGRYDAAELSAADVGAAFLTDGGLPRLLTVYETSPERAHLDEVRAFRHDLDELRRLDAAAERDGG